MERVKLTYSNKTKIPLPVELNVTVEILMKILRNATRKSSNCLNPNAKHGIREYIECLKMGVI